MQLEFIIRGGAEQAEILNRMWLNTLEHLGKVRYGFLPEEERHMMSQLIWIGCGMHKDLNTVKGGTRAYAQNVG